MFLANAKFAIELDPCVYKLMRPAARLYRRVKNCLFPPPMERFRKLCEELPNIVPDPVFVKVGANDGVTGDPCSDILLAKSSWKGLLIEPVPYCADRLRANFPDTRRFAVEQIAIGATAGKSTFYYVDQAAAEAIPDLPPWFDQLGSFDKSHILKHLEGVLEPYILECTMETRTLSEVLETRGFPEIHLLHIDTEGYDYEVIKTINFATHAPLVVFVEHMHLPPDERQQMRRFLRIHGYRVRDCGNDYFAIHKEANRRLRRTGRVSV